MSPELCTTEQAAERVGISRQTLQAWIRTKKITPPKPTLNGARSKRLWSTSALARLRKAKHKIFWTGQEGRRKRKQNGPPRSLHLLGSPNHQRRVSSHGNSDERTTTKTAVETRGHSRNLRPSLNHSFNPYLRFQTGANSRIGVGPSAGRH